jgi:hypothetical protein
MMLNLMETKERAIEKDFDSIKMFRAIKEKISKDISKMTLAQIKEYLQNQKLNPAV